MLEISLSPFPILETERLRLRQVTEQDAPSIFDLRSNVAVMKYLDRPPARNLEDALDLIEKIRYSFDHNEGITWAICMKEDQHLIGTIGYWRIDKPHHRAEIGYMLHEIYQGKGIMQEAISAVLNFGFRTLNLHSIEANVNPKNEASIRLLERNGFRQEAYFRENYFYNGMFLDSSIYSLLAPAYREKNG